MASVAAASFSLRDFVKSFLLVELVKGMSLTGRYALRRKVTGKRGGSCEPTESEARPAARQGNQAVKRADTRARQLHLHCAGVRQVCADR